MRSASGLKTAKAALVEASMGGYLVEVVLALVEEHVEVATGG